MRPTLRIFLPEPSTLLRRIMLSKILFLTRAALALSLLPALPAHAEGDLFVTLPAAVFEGGTRDSLLFGGGHSGYCDGQYCEMVTSANLPHGSRLVGIEIDACRDAEGDRPVHFLLLRRFGNDQATVSDVKFIKLAEGSVTTTGCDYKLGTTDETKPLGIDTFGFEYLVAVVIGDPFCGTFGQPSCPDYGSRFQAVRVYYEVNESGGTVEPTKPTGVPSFFP